MLRDHHLINTGRSEQWPNLTDKIEPHKPNCTELWANQRSGCRRTEPGDSFDASAVTQLELIFETNPQTTLTNSYIGKNSTTHSTTSKSTTELICNIATHLEPTDDSLTLFSEFQSFLSSLVAFHISLVCLLHLSLSDFPSFFLFFFFDKTLFLFASSYLN